MPANLATGYRVLMWSAEDSVFSRRGSEERTVILGTVADEGGSPEVDPVPDLLRLDEVTEVWILVPKADFPEVKEGSSP